MKIMSRIALAVLFAVLLAPGNRLHAQGNLGKFENAVRDMTYRSLDDPPIPGCWLYVGSSSFRLWKELENRFREDDAVNRGFGGSQISHNIAALDRIHRPYRPARITFFCGTNDLAGGKSVDEVFSDFKYYIARHWNEDPFVEIFYVSTTHAPVREKAWAAGDELFARIKDLASKTEGLHTIDIIRPMKGADGRVREDLFVKDRLHLNEEGYRIWTETFKKTYRETLRDSSGRDVRKLFEDRKALGLFDDPRFEKDGIAIKPPPQTDRPLNLVFIGDSITIGGADKSPPSRCAAYLEKQAGIGKVTTANLGVSGYTTVDFLPETKKQFLKVAEAADRFKDDAAGTLIFSVMLGTNDSAVTGPNGSPVSPERYRDNLRKIVDKLLADYPTAKVVLHRPIWYSDTTQNSATYLLEGQLRVTAYLNALEDLVGYYASSSDTGRVFLGDVNAFSYFKTHHEEAMRHETGKKGTFFLHPNDRGADVLGRFWGAAILDALEQD